MKKILYVIVVIIALTVMNKVFENFGKEDNEAYQNCVNKTNNQGYCERVVYGV